LFKDELITSSTAAARRREGADGAQVHHAHWLFDPLRATCKQNIVDDVGEAEYLSYRVGFLCLLHSCPTRDPNA
jgi:hypothetical protein